MVDMARGKFPREMVRAAHPESGNVLEHVAENTIETVARYARENPVPAILWSVGIGFVLGWRLKPW
jgi:hypothetical protein